jgi:hypothetical protein
MKRPERISPAQFNLGVVETLLAERAKFSP